MGCCTACAVRVKSGEVRQVEALGVSQELRDAGYALMCVGFPTADCELEVANEDEVYELQVRHWEGGKRAAGVWGQGPRPSAPARQACRTGFPGSGPCLGRPRRERAANCAPDRACPRAPAAVWPLL
jgi:hypothetical protein